MPAQKEVQGSERNGSMHIPHIPTESILVFFGALVVLVGGVCGTIRYFASEIRDTVKALRRPEDNSPPGARGGTP